MTPARRLAVLGAGRAGRSMAGALSGAGWTVGGLLGRGDDPAAAARGVDLLLIATPDASVAEVAAAVEPVSTTVVAHLSGALGLDVLAGHPRRAALHPLVSLPHPEVGARSLAAGAWFAVAGDPLVQAVVDDLGGRWFEVADHDRARYHAAACIASNHLVGLLGQVDRIAGSVGVPLAAYLDLARASVDNVGALGPADALTGPVARGDWATVRAHLDALPGDERAGYEAGAELARRLAAQPAPDWWPPAPTDEG